MSAAVRQAIAAAANTVEGITCSEYYWQTAKAGAAMVRFENTDYTVPFGGVSTWAVWVLVPTNIAAAEKWIDTWVPALVAALDKTVISVTRATPQMFVFESGQVPGVSIEGTRETE